MSAIIQTDAGPPLGRAPIDVRPRRPAGTFFPLSFGQERIWLLEQWQPLNAAHTLVHGFAIEGHVDRGVLERAILEVARRHETWRTTIVEQGGRPLQRIAPAYTSPLVEIDAGGASLDALAAAEAAHGFDLHHGPLVHATLVRLAPQRSALMIAAHATVADEASGDRLFHELAALLAAPGRVPPLPSISVQYGDYAAWQRQQAEHGAMDAGLEYWARRLDGAPAVLALATDRPRPAVQTSRGATRRLELSPALASALDRFGGENATPFVTVVAAVTAVLSRYSGQTDIVFGMPVDERVAGETDGLFGPLTDTVVVRTDLSGDPSFADVVHRVRDAMADAASHADVPFARLIERLRPARNPSYSPVFQVLVASRRARPAPITFDDWTMTPVGLETGAASYDLTFEIAAAGGQAMLEVEYNTDLFDAVTIDRLLGHVTHLLECGLTQPARPIGDLPLLSEKEEASIRLLGRGAVRPGLSVRTVVRGIAERAARSPAAVAVADGTRLVSYAALDQQATALARRLRKHGVGPDVLVGVCLTRSVDLVTALLAVWKAGGAYVPLDPAYPAERLAFMIADAGLRVTVTESAALLALPPVTGELLMLDGPNAVRFREPEAGPAPPLPEARPDDLAYVIYTSGSTGRPKGVEIRHGAVANVLASLASWPGLDATDCMLAITTLAFDIAAVELWLPLLVGARVELASRAVAVDGAALCAAVRARGVTVMQATPATWRLLIDAGWDGSPPLRVWSGGEALPRDLADALLARTDRVWNLYGPTETTIWSAAGAVLPGDGPVSIGPPVANTELLVLDDRRRLAPIGVPGELYIGGVGLARGYHGRSALTAERFVAPPWDAGARLYRTGDRMRMRADGTLEFLGRFDDQLKLRGFRIEPSEIETALRGHAAVRDAVVTLHTADSDASLVAYLVVDPAVPLTPSALHTWLRATLPDYMVPSVFVEVEHLPRTPNGKVDRRALPPPMQARPVPRGEAAAPRTPLEARLARMWGDVLHVSPVGVHDNFFELGGHSLLGVRLFSRLEKEMGVRLPLSTLLETPTLEQMAQLLERKNDSPSWSSLVPIQREGDRTPFFCAHGAGANVLALRTLARHLGGDQPFYGLQSQGLDGRTSPYRRVEDMAAHYVGEIRAVQADGPYFIGGFSFGGIIAFEMAQQLCAQGAQVAALVLIDTFFPCRPDGFPPLSRFGALAWPVVSAVERGLEEWTRLGTARFVGRRTAWASEGVKRRLSRAVRLVAPRFAPDGWDISDSLREVIEANREAERAYVPRLYPGRIVLFWGTGESHAFHDTRLAWEEVARDGLDLHIVPGDHNSLREEPHVLVLARKLRAVLDRCGGSVGGS